MTRIIIHATGSTDDLSSCFLRAVTLLTNGGLKLRAGTKLVSRYCVIVVDEPQVQAAMKSLWAGNVQATLEA